MKKIVPLIQLTADFANVLRAVGYRKGHLENDAEHSFQLAIVCWSANHQYNLKLNDEKILKYALVHDLVELYAGDTDAFGDKNKIASKKDNEKKALDMFKKNNSQYKELLSIIYEYEQKEKTEAQLVYMLDKFIPDINLCNGNSDYYRDRKIDIYKWKEWMGNKIDYDSLSPKLKPLFDESVKEIETIYNTTFAI